MASMQEEFKKMLKDFIAPKLREIGFKGSGQNFTLPSDSHWALLGFQKLTFSDAAEVKFTINLYVVEKVAWSETRQVRSYPEKPTPGTFWGIGWQSRIGKLMPQKQDYWWSLNSATDPRQLSSDVGLAIEKYALPEIIRELKNA